MFFDKFYNKRKEETSRLSAFESIRKEREDRPKEKVSDLQLKSNDQQPAREKEVHVIPPDVYLGNILKYSYDRVPVVGAKYSGSDDQVKYLSPASFVTLKIESDNEYDSNAILVQTSKGVKIGYLEKESTIKKMAFDWISRKEPIYSIIDYYDGEAIKLSLSFYKSPSCIYKLSKEFKLVSNKNEEMQDEICGLSEGDEVNFESGFDSDKILVTSGAEIGYLSKSASEFVESIKGKDFCSLVDEISVDDNDKYSVKIIVYYND